MLGWLINIELVAGLSLGNFGSILVLLVAMLKVRSRGLRLGLMLPKKHLVFFGFPFFLCILFAILSLLAPSEQHAMIVNQNPSRIAVSWLLVAAAYLCGWVLGPDFCEDNSYIAWMAAIVFSTVLVTSSVFELGMSGGFRYAINSRLPGGINGFMYALFVAQVMLLPLITSSSRAKRAAIIALVVAPVIVGVLLGSRQYTGAVLMSPFVYMYIRASSKINFFLGTLRWAAAAIIIALISLQNTTVRESVSLRIAQTEKQLEFGSTRADVSGRAVDLVAWDHPFGSGPGYAKTRIGAAVENAYLEILVDYGWFPFAMLSAYLLYQLFFTLRARLASVAFDRTGAVWICIFVTIFWFCQFNELLREPFVWFGMGVLSSTALISKRRVPQAGVVHPPLPSY